MFKKKVKQEDANYSLTNLVVGLARSLKLNADDVAKKVLDFDGNTKFIEKLNSEIFTEVFGGNERRKSEQVSNKPTRKNTTKKGK